MSDHSSNYPEKLNTPLGVFTLREEYEYPNGARSLFYTFENLAIILDDGICDAGKNPEAWFSPVRCTPFSKIHITCHLVTWPAEIMQ